MARYRQKPEIVDVRQFTGGEENAKKVILWLKSKGVESRWVDTQTVLDLRLDECIHFVTDPEGDRILRSAYVTDYIVHKGDTWRIFREGDFLERFESF
jgi:hypothetical protein